MCWSMVDIQSATDEIRRGKKRKKETGQKYNVRTCYAERPWQHISASETQHTCNERHIACCIYTFHSLATLRTRVTQYIPLTDTKCTDVSLVVFVKHAAVFAHVELASSTQTFSLEEYRESLKTSNAWSVIEVLALWQHPRLGHFLPQVGFLGSVNNRISGPAHVVQWSNHLGAMCSRAWRSQWPRIDSSLGPSVSTY